MTGLRILVRRSLRSLGHTHHVLRSQSFLKQAFIIAFSVIWLASTGSIFYQIFRFLHNMGGAGFVLVPRLFALFFLGIGLMLVISGGVAGYAQLYQSRETRSLLSLPVPIRDIVYYKLLEAASLSSWAFFFIIVPFVGAYALYRGLSPWTALWTVSFSLPFVFLCSSFGVILAMLMARFFPRGPLFRKALWALPIVIILWFSMQGKALQTESAGDMLRLADLIPGIQFATHPLLPSWWLSEGIMSFTRADWPRGIMFFANLVFGFGMVAIAAGWLGDRIFFSGYQRVEFSGDPVQRRRALLLDRILHAIPLRAADVRAFLIKDIRIFLRDPAQWSQALIFFGLLGLYFINIHGVNFTQLDRLWRNLIGFLNVFSLSAVMCSLAARFVYPQLSLEGQGIWIVGLAPTNLRRVLFIKFFASSIALLVAGLVLTVLSSVMLGLPGPMVALTCLLIVCNAIGLSGLANGLGACYIDTEVKAPSAIISGFGGTLNLILGLLFIALTVVPAAMLMHFRTLARVADERFQWWLIACVLLSLVLAVMAAWIPMRLGARHLERRDY